MSSYMRNCDGVHFVPVEHALCGDAFDIGEPRLGWRRSSEQDPPDEMVIVNKQKVTCEGCADHIRIILAEFGKSRAYNK